MKSFSISFIFLLLLAACNNKKTEQPVTTPVVVTDTVPHPSIKDVLMEKPLSLGESTALMLRLLKQDHMAAFSNYIHPTEGIRFSAYGYIDTTDDRHFTQESFRYLITHPDKKVNWGSYDGSGDPIKLNLHDYLKRFVYDKDFLNAEKTSQNEMIGGGNSLNNLLKIYPDASFTESYFSGFDKKMEGMDWVTLRLVYKKYQGKFYLIAVVHDQWTI